MLVIVIITFCAFFFAIFHGTDAKKRPLLLCPEMWSPTAAIFFHSFSAHSFLRTFNDVTRLPVAMVDLRSVCSANVFASSFLRQVSTHGSERSRSRTFFGLAVVQRRRQTNVQRTLHGRLFSYVTFYVIVRSPINLPNLS